MTAGITHRIVTLNNSAQTIVTDTGEPSNLRANVSFQNLGDDIVYFGGDGVSQSSYGTFILPGGALSIDDLPGSFDIYAISVEPTCDIAVLEVSYA